ncbi:hypothetical protein DNTS_003307 [Danionella cerebrum]|uniref:Uncharacterized protein n=1 Tax=Danionella cerebrum TaxID=2873325 RepID=A0A553MVR1_9TELE|nr:hypothetical protein DNTS_003307 [Danionella translucida]
MREELFLLHQHSNHPTDLTSRGLDEPRNPRFSGTPQTPMCRGNAGSFSVSIPRRAAFLLLLLHLHAACSSWHLDRSVALRAQAPQAADLGSKVPTKALSGKIWGVPWRPCLELIRDWRFEARASTERGSASLRSGRGGTPHQTELKLLSRDRRSTQTYPNINTHTAGRGCWRFDDEHQDTPDAPSNLTRTRLGDRALWSEDASPDSPERSLITAEKLCRTSETPRGAEQGVEGRVKSV